MLICSANHDNQHHERSLLLVLAIYLFTISRGWAQRLKQFSITYFDHISAEKSKAVLCNQSEGSKHIPPFPPQKTALKLYDPNHLDQEA